MAHLGMEWNGMLGWKRLSVGERAEPHGLSWGEGQTNANWKFVLTLSQQLYPTLQWLIAKGKKISSVQLSVNFSSTMSFPSTCEYTCIFFIREISRVSQNNNVWNLRHEMIQSTD